jgi:hypothetical protein
MANSHDLFIDFDDIIKLSHSKKKSLHASKKAVKDKIKKWFSENKKEFKVLFKGQGSNAMNTTILPNSGEYDIDYGIYIISKIEDRPTPQTAHTWVLSAIDDHTDNIMDKNTCVRIIYSDDKKHIDLPIYFKTKSDSNYFEEVPTLAHKADSWIESDPYKFVEWFEAKAKDKDQLKRIVRYLKAWTDNKSSGAKMPSGLVMTILAGNNYVSKNRDDEAFLETLKAIRRVINPSYGGRYVCYRPTPKTDEDLLSKYDKDTFLNNLDNLITSGEQAINEATKPKDACKKWQKHLGDRFPCSNLKDDETTENAKSFSSPDVIFSNAKSA